MMQTNQHIAANMRTEGLLLEEVHRNHCVPDAQGNGSLWLEHACMREQLGEKAGIERTPPPSGAFSTFMRINQGLPDCMH